MRNIRPGNWLGIFWGIHFSAKCDVWIAHIPPATSPPSEMYIDSYNIEKKYAPVLFTSLNMHAAHSSFEMGFPGLVLNPLSVFFSRMYCDVDMWVWFYYRVSSGTRSCKVSSLVLSRISSPTSTRWTKTLNSTSRYVFYSISFQPFINSKTRKQKK